MHTHSITSSGLFRGAPGKHWLPARSHPAARAWLRQEPSRPLPGPTTPTSQRDLAGLQPDPPAAPSGSPFLPVTSRPPRGPSSPQISPTAPAQTSRPSPAADGPRRLHLPACNGASPGRSAAEPAAGHTGSWSRALAVAQHPLGARGGAGLSQEHGSHCRRGREQQFPRGPQDSALGDGECLRLLGSLGGGRADGGSGVELRAGFWQPGRAAARGRARPFLWRPRAEGREAALGGLAGAVQAAGAAQASGPGARRRPLGNRGAPAAGRGGRRASSLPRGSAWEGLVPAGLLRRTAGRRQGLDTSVKLSPPPGQPEGRAPRAGPTPR